jgi:pyrimidine-nucleoside phosphorylase
LIGRACIVLGAGRKTVEDRVDHAVGISGLVKIGERVEKGQPLAILHANDKRKLGEAVELLKGAFVISDEKRGGSELIMETIG